MKVRINNMFRSSFVTIIMLLLLLIILNPMQVNAEASWEAVGGKGFSIGNASTTNLLFKDGTPYVAYIDDKNGAKVVVMKYNGTDWEAVGNIEGRNVTPSMQIAEGTLYVAYCDFLHESKGGLRRYNGTDWETVGGEYFTSKYVSSLILQMDDKTPYIAYNNQKEGDKLTVMRYKGNSWETIGGENFTTGKAREFAFQVSEGIPYVAYQDEAHDNKLTVMKYNGVNWENVGSVGFSSGEIHSVSLKIINKIPYVAYDDSLNGRKLVVMKYSDNNWKTVGSAGFSIGGVNYISLEEEEGMPYVAYQQNFFDYFNGQKLTVMRFNGIEWESVGNAGFSDGSAGQISLKVEDGIPYVAYRDNAHDNKLTVMKYENVIDNYTVNFEAGLGGSLSGGNVTKTFDSGYEIKEADIPMPISDEGYHFTGWTPSNPKGESVTANVTYTANFSNTYTVTYESGANGTIEEAGKTESVIHNNNPASVPTVTAKEGYKFVGWTREGVDVTPSTVQIIEDATFVAKYASIYDIAFEAGLGGSLSGGNVTKTFDSGYEIKEADIPTPISDEGYHFTGWTPSNPKGESVTVNVTYTANFSNTYTVTYESGANGTIEEAGKTESVVYNNNPASVPTVTAKSGYKFVGWTRAGADVTPSTVQIVEDTTFVAKYASIYDIAFEAGLGGSLSGGNVTKTFDSGYEIKEADIPTPIADEGYHFTGWTPTNPLGQEVSEDVTYTANFSNTYTVTYESGANGTIEEAGKTESVIYNNNPASVPTVTAKEGYKFVGWTREGVDVTPSTVQIIENTTFVAKCAANSRGHKKKNSSNTTGTDGQIVISKDTIKKGDSITVEDKKFEAEVTFKKEVVKEIKNNNPNSDVILAIEKVDISKSTKNIKAKTDNEDYYKISVKANNKDIRLAKGDMTVTIPFIGTGKPVVINVDDNCRADMSYNSSEKLVTVYLKGSTELAILDIHHKFIDVENGWYESYVNTLANSEVMNGTTDITFEPDKYMTRAEFVTTLARMSQEELNSRETKFSDVSEKIWYSQYVNWAVNSSITTGTSESTFSPNNGITREQMATMLVRFSEYKNIKLSDENKTKKFSDNSLISPYALDAVYLMQKSGIINGKGENIFDPQGHATRAECAKMLSVLSLELS